MQVQPEDRPNNIHRKEDRTTRPPRTEKTLPRDHPNTSHYTPHLDLSPTAKQITVFNFYYNFYRNTNILCHSLPRLHLPLLTSVHSGHPVLPPTPPTTTTPTISPHLPIPSPLFLPPSLSRYRVPVRRASIGKTINRYFYALLCPEFAPLLQVHKYTHTPPSKPP